MTWVRVYPKVSCPDCSGTMEARSTRCKPCQQKQATARSAARRKCADCGGLTSDVQWKRCRACYQRSRNPRACMDCGKHPIKCGAKRCKPCWEVATAAGIETNGLLARFNAAAFRELLERDDVEWTPGMLAAESGLPTKTILRWRNGSLRPRTVEWRQLAAVLALRPCTHCHGSGTVDPTAESIDAISRAVQVSGVALPAPEPLIKGAGWTLDRNALTLTVNGVELQTTQREAQVIAVLAAAGGRHVTAVQLGVKLGVANHAIHTYLARLRGKCSAAGVDIGHVVQNGHGSGYRAVLTSREEAAS